jgi:hypothetical protein
MNNAHSGKTDAEDLSNMSDQQLLEQINLAYADGPTEDEIVMLRAGQAIYSRMLELQKEDWYYEIDEEPA